MRGSTVVRRSRSFRVRRLSMVALPVALMLLAACGSSSSNNSASTSYGGASSPTSVHAAVNAKTTVMVSKNPTLGSVLTDVNGMTLYTLTNAGEPVACTGQCATLWPPLLLPAGVTTATGGAGASGLGVISMNGGMQVTVHGDPVYRYSGDKAPGDANGQGLKSFGGVWHVAGTAGASASSAPTTTTPAAMGGYGGYGG